ncbi:SDR family NAD(P)-dependent oxidoreductase [Xinfangfangia pollutisoli]|uniref:SDR family NAD(P)-dependent oxidoreductase n=1 Tax=Xinfangfangia pollutisoli TaxID=2865960 RepID=UPI001CD22783|nr:SDR family NAD(P)-dependent oxidoreductase [Xinfangfangia pollutisoli]
MQGKRIFITGGATGIGAATGRHLRKLGARVWATGLDAGAGRALAAELDDADFTFHPADLTVEDQVRGAVGAMVAAWGGIDGVVNAAGIYPTGKRLEDLSDAEWTRTLDVNLTAIFRVCRATLPLIRAAGGGSVVNIASVHAEATVPLVPAYAASKGAVVALSRQLALDYAQDLIRVNAVIVGSVATRMTLDGLEAAGGAEAAGLSFSRRAVGRIADPAEIATVIAFLLSDAASFVTGSALQADGAMLARLL